MCMFLCVCVDINFQLNWINTKEHDWWIVWSSGAYQLWPSRGLEIKEDIVGQGGSFEECIAFVQEEQEKNGVSRDRQMGVL